MENWEEWAEKDNAEEWPELAVNKENPSKKATLSTQGKNFLNDQALRTAHPYFESQPTFKILAKKSNNDQKSSESSSTSTHSSKSNSTSESTNQQKSLEERERAYAEARARIMGSGSPAPSPEPVTSAPGPSSSSPRDLTPNSSNRGRRGGIRGKKRG
eukprot:TRINITY_DN900_c0_g1_i1.p1 TRINITY_DN900_c0_g1~~TRINITY_DN900_c0_g1_i1.p1  ORF type:complete len:158 (+),score=29.36 TRINITY_DN900_c0_g1_i1:119-592(+)